MTISIIFILILAFILDAVFKDPKYIPHIVTFIGKGTKYGEIFIRRAFRPGKYTELFGGFLLTIIIVVLSFIVPYLVLSLCFNINPYLYHIVELFLCFQLLAHGSLKESAMAVYSELSVNNIDGAREKLSHIVGRDTENLNEEQIVKATVETVSENTNDGIIAPIFYILIGGVFFGMVYKAVNTLDSMIGYKNEKYRYFGRFAARLDDVLNIIPARITGLLYVGAAFLAGFDYKNSYKILVRDRWNHASPNSGYPESAIAGALDIQLGGSSYYFGEYVEKKTIGDNVREANLEDIPKSCMLMTISSVIGLVALILLKIVIVTVIHYGKEL